MALTKEWRKRIEAWQKRLETLFYRPLADVDLEGFVTLDRLSPQQACRRAFKPMPEGAKWGPKWSCCWLRTRVRLPEEARGRRIVLRPRPGGETLVFVNGAAAGAIDQGHAEVTLCRRGVPGAAYSILMEAYAGHGPLVWEVGPAPEGFVPVPQPPARQAEVGRSSFGVWEEDAFQLWVDADTLLQLRDCIDQNSLRVSEIDEGLRDYTTICDLELPREEMMRTIAAARRRLRPLLECRNGSTAPKLFCAGHAHLDVAWLWPLEETERKIGRTIATQLALMKEYPEYRYLQSQPHLCLMLKSRHPEIYKRFRAAAQGGRVVPEGGMWVEADTNVPSGESLIRQLVLGRRFFKEEFGRDCELLWLPDVFGYSAALPQIMKGCRVRYFATSKIFWNYYGGDPFPYNIFWWQGADGTRVLAHLYSDYGSAASPAALAAHWNGMVQKDGVRSRIVPFGLGDGGGGASRLHLEYLRRERDLEGLPRAVIASPADFFHDIEKDAARLPVYVGELYYQCHRGTYTSQARVKRGNRKCEFGLREAEMWSAAAAVLRGAAYPARRLDQAWKTVLLTQFHDIIPGSSIRRVYEEAEAGHAEVLATTTALSTAAAGKIAKRRPGSFTVFNSLSWERSCLIKLPEGLSGARLPDGRSLPVQKTGGALVAEVGPVPPCGWVSVRDAEPAAVENNLKASANLIENERLRVRFDAAGEIASIFDKDAGCELAAGPCNSLRMFKDVPVSYDAWDLESTYRSCPVAVSGGAEIEVEDRGPLVASVRIVRKIGRSRLTQRVSLRRGARRIDFQTVADWRESHKVLKACFPVAVRAENAIHEIQFGHLPRPAHASRPFDADRFEVCAHKWTALAEEGRGCAVLNDCKYGVSARDGAIELTLLRAPLAPDMEADKGAHEFTYAFYCWNGAFRDCGLVREAYDLNVPVTAIPGWAGQCSLLSVSDPNVVIETVKLADDGSGDLVVRLYEAKRTTARCALSAGFPVKAALIANMLEEPVRKIRVVRNSVAIELRPFEVKTVILKVKR